MSCEFVDYKAVLIPLLMFFSLNILLNYLQYRDALRYQFQRAANGYRLAVFRDLIILTSMSLDWVFSFGFLF